MPITLDPSLPSSLYPLAWLIGSWRGVGALQSPDAPDGGRRIEQQLDCTAQEDGTLAWTSLIHVVDSPAPLPPTSAFARDDAPAPAAGTGERSLLMRERGVWSVGDPLPGQDLEAAAAAPPGSPQAIISSALTARFERDGVREEWSGEARGPRLQLALPGSAGVEATRMFGYVSGRLMWLWERRDPSAGDGSLAPYLSVELDRA